ncbi:MAG: nucleoside-diphosphate kinase [Dermabacter sp.]|nr:nucleoside-diphosphate kinase [Dermabacter sp.]
MSTERTLLLLKPDAVARNLRGEIIRRIETKGFSILALGQRTATASELSRHYAEHEGKPFYPALVSYMASGPLVALVVEGTEVIATMRTLMGATNPAEALPGTIRGDLARLWDLPVIHNLVHGSDSVESAEREIAIWFPELS